MKQTSTEHRILVINVNRHQSSIEVHSNKHTPLLGISLANLLYKEYQEDDPIIFARGTFTGLLPFCNTVTIVYRSPLTENYIEEYGQGGFGSMMTYCGLDAIVLVNQSKTPVTIEIVDNQVSFHSAKDYWDANITKSAKHLRSKYGLPGKQSSLVIGPAAINKIKFASAVIDSWWEVSRGGLGYRLGKSQIKGISISGTKSITPEDLKEYHALLDELRSRISLNSDEYLYPGFSKYGNLSGIFQQRTVNGLPMSNWSGNSVDTKLFNEDQFFVDHEIKQISSFFNLVPDLNLIEWEENFLPVDYASVVSLTSLLGISNPTDFLTLRKITFENGLDPVHMGVLIGWIAQHQRISSNNAATGIQIIQALLKRQDNWAILMAGGARQIASEMGGLDYCMQINNLPLMPYFNGYGTILSPLISASQNIYDSDGHLYDLAMLGELFEDELLVDVLVEREKENGLFNSLGVNYSARLLYANKVTIRRALNAFGINIPGSDMLKISQEVYNNRQQFKKIITEFPERLFTTTSAYGLLRRNRLEKMLDYFYDNYC